MYNVNTSSYHKKIILFSQLCLPVAIASIACNATLNDLELQVTTRDLIGSHLPQIDAVLLGDMFYDTDFATTIASWLSELQTRGIQVLF